MIQFFALVIWSIPAFLAYKDAKEIGLKTYSSWAIGTYFGGVLVMVPYLFVRKRILLQGEKKDAIDAEYREVNENKEEVNL